MHRSANQLERAKLGKQTFDVDEGLLAGRTRTRAQILGNPLRAPPPVARLQDERRNFIEDVHALVYGIVNDHVVPGGAIFEVGGGGHEAVGHGEDLQKVGWSR
jgi:hypothetical protein